MSYSTRIYRKRNVNLQNDIKVKSPAFFHSHETRVASKNSDTAFFQPKLSIGQPNDAYEKEADSVADKVVSNPTGNIPGVQQKEICSIQRVKGEMDDENISDRGNNVAGEEELQQKPDLQKKCDGCEKEEKEKSGVMQMKPEGGSIASPKISSKITSSSGKGNTLPGRTLSEMNHSFGSDFSNVKIHTDSEAVQLNRELGAQAFTHGNDIYFNSSKFDPASSSGKHLLAHELTHVVQQNRGLGENIQRSCNDGQCESCSGGMRDFWITFYFRRRATRRTMNYLRTQMNEAKRVLANCCLNLKADFNWTLMPGGGQMDPLENTGGNWSYTNDASQLGTGAAFNGSRGIPVLVVDNVDDSGGGVTVTQNQTFDQAYSGRTYAVIAVNQADSNDDCNTLAHELWHVGSGEGHDIAHGTLAACTGNDVSPEFCTGLRNIVAPVGDFPVPSQENNTAIA